MATILVAYDEGRVIGNSRTNSIPWHVPEDLKLFKERTMGHPVVMGYNTYASLPEKYRPLTGRINIVITKKHGDKLPLDVFCASSIERALEIASSQSDQEIFIIGGASIYQAALDANVVDRIVVSKIRDSYYGDILFPYLEPAWKAQIVERRDQFDVWEYRKYPRD